jgi:CBS domain-containing protein
VRSHVARLQDLRFLLDSSITAKHIGTFPVDTCQASKDTQSAKSLMEERGFDVLPLEDEEGTITGYVERSSLGTGRCADYKRSFFPSEVVADSTPLEALFKILRDSPRVFVLENNSITGIITRADLQKAPVRILLFGLVTILEIRILHLIRHYYPNDSWQGFLTPGRLDAAKKVYSQRVVRNEEIDLADCLQLCDKRTLVLKDDRIRESLSLGSKNKAERFLEDVEQLRNRLAHGQDIVAGSSWFEVFSLTQEIEKVLEQGEQ